MVFPTVTNTMKDPTGAAITGQVTIQLVTPGFDTSQIEVASTVVTTNSPGGVWSAQLEPNSLINPSGTFYRVTEPTGNQWTFIVPNGAGPYQLVNILTTSPSPPPTTLGAIRYDADQTGALTAAQQAVAAQNAGLLPNFDALFPIFAYGNSYAVMTATSYTAGLHYLQQSQTRLRAGALTSYGVSGTRIVDVLCSMVNGAAIPGCIAPVSGGTWPGSSRSGLVVFDTLVNDIGHYAAQSSPIPAAITTANQNYRNGFKGMLRAALALASSGSRIEDTTSVHTGAGWTVAAAAAYASGGTLSFTSTPGNKTSYTVTPPQSGPLAGKVFFLTYKIDPSLGAMAQITIDVDGANAVNYTPAPYEQYTGSTATVNLVWECFAITVPVDGNAHTVNLTHSGSAGQLMYEDALIIPSTTPNPIAMMGNEAMPVVGTWNAAQVAIYTANANMLLADAKSVTAEFPNAFYVPSNITSNGLYSGDGIHPNDRGHGQRTSDLINAALPVIKARMDAYVLQQMPNSAFAKL